MNCAFDSLLDLTFPTDLNYDFWPALETDSRKLLIVLHGRGDSAEGYHWLPEALGIDEFNFLFLNAPDPYQLGFSWYPVAPNQGPGILRSRQLLFDLLDKIQNKCGLRSTEIFLFGFSQGCLMSLDTVLRYPKVLGGAVGASGFVFFLEEYPKALSPVASLQHIMVNHGPADPMLPFEKTKAQIIRLQNMGLSIDWREYDKEHSIDHNLEIHDIKAFFRRLLDAS